MRKPWLLQIQTCYWTKRGATLVTTTQEAIWEERQQGQLPMYTPGATTQASVEWKHCVHTDT